MATYTPDQKEESKQNGSGGFLSTGNGKTKSNAIEVPSITLPKGGGAIRGIDEKFSVNAVNGTAAFSIQLPVTQARGVVPALSIAYNSGAGNGIFGLGWSLNLSSIKRKTDKKLPRYTDDIDADIFIFSEADELVPEFAKDGDGSFINGDDGEYVIKEKNSADLQYRIRFYRPAIEGSFSRIERWKKNDGTEMKWRVISKDNITTQFGWSPGSRLADPKDGTKIFEWFPEFIFDDKGNCAKYLYKSEDGKGIDPSKISNRNRFVNNGITYTNLYPDKIFYGNKTPYKNFADAIPADNDFLFEIAFDYGTLKETDSPVVINEWDFRQDAFSVYRAGFEIRTTRLCKRVLLLHHFTNANEYDGLVRSLNISYDATAEQNFTFLSAITSFGYIKKEDGTYTSKHFPPFSFGYQKHEWNSDIKTLQPGALINVPAGIEEPPYQFVDLFNEGLSGILTEQATGWYYKHNLGNGNFAQAKLVSPKPSLLGVGSTLSLADLDADGGRQLVNYQTEPKGFFELDDDNEWQAQRLFSSLPNINFNDPFTRMIDLNGDGKPELLITEENVFTWYESAGRNGFKSAQKISRPLDEEKGPAMVFADPLQTIFLADMSGDGLTDIVRIKNKEVCYWPNLGYGKFGAKVAMDNAPLFDSSPDFNPSYIRLADIDGSGTSDIIYLGKNQFSCWKNLSGNGFAGEPFVINHFPEIHASAKVTVTDLLGNGVACIVWSSALTKDTGSAMKYIDLMNSKKPHIMVAYKNNLGKEVSFEYKPSTQFYMDDKLAGKPWITKLHFPVHCVSKSTVQDKVTGSQFITTYKYHHGYYDHAEGEFRGFGMTEQTDTEIFEHWVKSSASNITEKDLHQEPVITKQWFHTGAFLRNGKILSQFETEYWFQELKRRNINFTQNEKQLTDAFIIPAKGLSQSLVDNLSAEEYQQALRACKGMPLRAEIFADDAAKYDNSTEAIERALTPYTVATHNCVIELLQPKGNNQKAVFIVKEREAITYNYERNSKDPRIAHTINVKLDEFGNVLESAKIVYPRLLVDDDLPPETKAEQGKTHIIYTNSIFTNNCTDDVLFPNDYRLPLPAEIKTYQLTIAPKAGYYAIADFENILADDQSDTAAYFETDKPLVAGKPQKRLIEHIRSIYYKNDLTGALPLYQLETLAIPFESYQLAYTAAMVNDIYAGKVNEALLAEGKFVHSENDSNWWIRSGNIQLIDGAETKADAQNRFYTALFYTDPFGAVTKVKYYGNYFLFINETVDALGNRTGVDAFNFRTMSPRKIKDINGNFSEVIADEMGMVKAIALMGKGNEADELAGITEHTDEAEQQLINDFFTATDSVQLTIIAKSLLQLSTSRFVYQLDAFINHSKPAVVAVVNREEHFKKNPNAAVQIGFEYSNGIGKTVMKKQQAEPGIAKQVVVNPDGSIIINSIDTSALNPKKLRWIGNGKTILNNKGNAVKQYEPYFSTSFQYEDLKELVETGVTAILYYDALGRLIKTEKPDGSFSSVEFDAWKQVLYDANDNVSASEWYLRRTDAARPDFITDSKEQEAAAKALKHAATPNTLHFDALGRTVLSIEHNKNITTNTNEFYRTKVKLDVEGNLISVTDARETAANGNKGNTVMQYKYDMLGNMVYQNSMDAGQRWLLQNVGGKPLHTWDERNHEFQYSYDVLQRPAQSKVIGGDGESPLDHIFSRIIYGESMLQPNRANEAALQAMNVLGKPIKTFDTAGLIETPGYDFKDRPLATSRKLFSNYKSVANWTDANLVNDLEATAFTFTDETDALNRTTQQTAPDGSLIKFFYNEAGLLNAQSVLHPGAANAVDYIKDIDYNEKGQREKIIYRNDVTTKFYYDPLTFRLRRLENKRLNNDPLQDWYYTYDPMGNITHIEDKNVPVTFFDNEKITGLSLYTYDALYRLVSATGRENAIALAFNNSDNWNDAAFMQSMNPGDAMAMRTYTQTYAYDEVGNIQQMKHVAGGNNNWTRNYVYEALNNRIRSTQVGDIAAPVNYTRYTHHQQHGFLTALPHLDEIGWSFKEELIKSVQQKVNPGNGTAETTYYQYDVNGQRIRKITENAAAAGVIPAKKEERIYIGTYELYTKYSGPSAGLKRESLSLMDTGHRFVMIETRNDVDDGTEKQLVRYQFHNHLGSVALELDSNAAVISYEEFHPYGTTAYQARNASIKSAFKRYRYTGMERDEETGLEYHSARYYLPWLGRWMSCDKQKEKETTNRYVYVKNNPLLYFDRNGLYEEPVHGAVTYKLALAAGFTEKDAAEVALATAGMDHDPATSPGLNDWTARLHFPSFEDALKGVNTEIGKGTDMDLKTFGQRLHSLEDVGFKDAPGPHRRGDGPALGTTLARAGIGLGLTGAFFTGVGIKLMGTASGLGEKIAFGVIIGIGVVAALLSLATFIAALVIGDKIGHPIYTTEKNNESDSFSHAADEAYQDPNANTKELKGVYQVLKRAAIAKYGRNVVSNDALADEVIEGVVTANTEGKVNAYLNEPGKDAQGNSVHSYSDWVARQSECGTPAFGNIVQWGRSHIDASINNGDFTYRPLPKVQLQTICR